MGGKFDNSFDKAVHNLNVMIFVVSLVIFLISVYILMSA